MSELPNPDHLRPDDVFSPGGQERHLRIEPLPLDPPWTGWDVVRLLVVAFLAIFFTSMVAFEIAHVVNPTAKPADIARNPLVVVPAQAAAYVVLLAFMVLLVRRAYSRPFWRAVHWNFHSQRAIVFLLCGVLLAIAIEGASNFLPIPKSLPIDEFFRSRSSAWMMAAFGTLIAPLVEEMFFRGFLYPVLRRRIGVTLGVGITALFFALIHASQLAHAWAPLTMLFCVGLALTITREITDSVAASTLLHTAYNGTLFTMVWLATDHFRHLERLSQ